MTIGVKCTWRTCAVGAPGPVWTVEAVWSIVYDIHVRFRTAGHPKVLQLREENAQAEWAVVCHDTRDKICPIWSYESVSHEKPRRNARIRPVVHARRPIMRMAAIRRTCRQTCRWCATRVCNRRRPLSAGEGRQTRAGRPWRILGALCSWCGCRIRRRCRARPSK